MAKFCLLFLSLCLFSTCRADEIDLQQLTDLKEAGGGDEALAAAVLKLTKAIDTQKEELLNYLEEMKAELLQEMRTMITDAQANLRVMNNNTRTDLATLQQLLDQNECTDMTHNCSTDASCMDTRISFRCNCKPGFIGDGYTCQDIDECIEANDCDSNATCINLPGSYNCKCNDGFSGDGQTCEDIDECNDGSEKCHKFAQCTNTVGSYNCSCGLYYEGDGYTCFEVTVSGCNSPFKFVRDVGCIHMIRREETFYEGRENCKELGGDLFVAMNKEHYLRLAQYFIDSGQRDVKKYMWVGVKEGVWLNGRKVAPEEEAPRNPSMGSEKCSYTDGDRDEKFLLWTDPCSYDWWSLCEKNVTISS